MRRVGWLLMLLLAPLLALGSVAPRPAVAASAAARALPTPIPAATCAALHPARWMVATGQTDPRGTLRVFAIQWRQDISRVVSYASFRTAVRCTIQDQVLPHLRAGEPALVVFDEDIGLMTLAIGTRGATARAQAANETLAAPAGANAPAPAGALSAIGELEVSYAPQMALYQSMFPGINPVKALFLAATDTFARAFSQTFSDVASDYGLYVEANNNQATYRESTNTTDIAEFADPDLLPGATSAFVATSPNVYNTAFIWGPSVVNPAAPTGEKNLLMRNLKVPLTAFEQNDLFLDNGPSTGAAAVANLEPVTIAGFRVGVATSLPAFVYGSATAAPCADTAQTYIRCLDSLGVDVLLQPDANDGAWTGPGSQTDWQPLEWMTSSYRAVTDPTTHFRYAVNPMMTGNLFDIPFDGQSGIFGRDVTSTGSYVGDVEVDPQDYAGDASYHGVESHVLAVAPWVVPDESRAALRTVGAALEPGSGDATENAYIETALYADLLPADAAPAAVAPAATLSAVVSIATALTIARAHPAMRSRRRPVSRRTPVQSRRTLAFTGADPLVPALGGVALLGGLVVARRRRRLGGMNTPLGNRGQSVGRPGAADSGPTASRVASAYE